MAKKRLKYKNYWNWKKTYWSWSDNYFTTPEFNTLAASVFNATLALADLVRKMYFDAKLLSVNKKITANKTKQLLVENELKKLKIFDWSYFIGKRHFEEDSTKKLFNISVKVQSF